MKIHGHSIQGKREYQQDLIFQQENMVALADGMGGHVHGDLAAEAFIAQIEKAKTAIGITNAFFQADVELKASGDNRGTTGLVGFFIPVQEGPEKNPQDPYAHLVGVLHLFSVGDSPVWKFTNAIFPPRPAFLLDEDPTSGALTNGIGFMSVVHHSMELVEKGHKYLLASDGIDSLSPTDMKTILYDPKNQDQNLAQILCDRALKKGSTDNISAIVLEF